MQAGGAGAPAGNWRARPKARVPARKKWRRWTGIEPAGRGSPVPPALKAGGPTRRPDTSVAHPIPSTPFPRPTLTG